MATRVLPPDPSSGFVGADSAWLIWCEFAVKGIVADGEDTLP